MPVVPSLSGKMPAIDDVAALSIRKNISINLRRLIEDASLSQKQAADKLGYSEARLSNWLNEKNFMEEKVFNHIRDVFGWSYEQLVRDPVNTSSTNLFLAVERLADDAGYDLVKRPKS